MIKAQIYAIKGRWLTKKRAFKTSSAELKYIRKNKIMEKRGNSPFIAIISVFFFWGFLAASNGIFIPFCKTHFQLSQFQSQLVDSAFYGAYFIGSLLLYIFSLRLNKDIINSLGYKKTIIYGLLISIAGALLMIPGIQSGSFAFILLALFVIALGFSFQQTSANPLVLNIGDPAKGSHRLNFAGSLNSFGTTIGPIIVSVLLFGKVIASEADKTTAAISSINILYIILAIAFALAGAVLMFTKIPKLSIEEGSERMKVLKTPLQFIMGILMTLMLIFIYFAVQARERPSEFLFLLILAVFMLVFASVLFRQYRMISAREGFEQKAYPQVLLGMLAIFIYVGVEVTIQSNLGALLKLPDFGSLSNAEISPYISLYWGSLMIGRWTGAIGAFNMSNRLSFLLTLVVPFLALALVLYMNYLNGGGYAHFLSYSVCVAVLVLAMLAGKQKPVLTLVIFSGLGFIAMLIGLLTTGTLSIYAFLSGGLFCSIMWPCIFSLATAGLGAYTSQASGFLIMMILGGAFIPPVQGLIADAFSIQSSYLVAVVCFAFLTWYALRMRHILTKAGIDYDNANASAH